MSMIHWSVEPTPVDHPDVAPVLRAYMTELVGRYHRRPATEAEVDDALADEPAEGLAAFLLARGDRGEVTGCIGLRRVGPALGELTKVFVRPEARGQGGGAQLIAAAETVALGLGISTLRLDTRADLIEARALYARSGFREIPRYNEDRYAAHWFQKELVRPPAAS